MADPAPLFSICIPNYNYGRFIVETIEGVLNQTFQDFEIIVADNASTDDSVDRVEALRSDRIRIVRNRHNVGFATNLQRATMHARGEFINLLSSDDQMNPTALETYATIIEAHPEERRKLVLMSDVEGFDDTGRTLRLIRRAPGGFGRVSLPADTRVPEDPMYTAHRGHDVLRDRLRDLDTAGVFCSIVYSRALWENVEGYHAMRTIGPDKHFNYELLAQDPTVVWVNRPLYRYRDYVSDNRAAVASTIRHPIDDYLNILEFGTDEFLQPLGLRRADLERAFVERFLREALVQIGLGNDKLARRLFGFTLSTFPGRAFGVRYTYALLALLPLGRLGGLIAPPLRRAYLRMAPHSRTKVLAGEDRSPS